MVYEQVYLGGVYLGCVPWGVPRGVYHGVYIGKRGILRRVLSPFFGRKRDPEARFIPVLWEKCVRERPPEGHSLGETEHKTGINETQRALPGMVGPPSSWYICLPG